MCRQLKVYYNTQNRSNCQSVTNPQIMLTGKWLKALGFHIGDSITLNCEQGRIVIENNAVVATENYEPQMSLF